jgi:hypothetical protein
MEQARRCWWSYDRFEKEVFFYWICQIRGWWSWQHFPSSIGNLIFIFFPIQKRIDIRCVTLFSNVSVNTLSRSWHVTFSLWSTSGKKTKKVISFDLFSGRGNAVSFIILLTWVRSNHFLVDFVIWNKDVEYIRSFWHSNKY